jgi:hypothetical protein
METGACAALEVYRENLGDIEKQIGETVARIQKNVVYDCGCDQPGISTVHGALELASLVNQKRMLMRFITTLERIING